MTPTAAMMRLFPHHEADAVAASPLLVARLLEDGDGRDLASLFESMGESAVAAWLAERGGRQLSRRSRAFWTLVLGVPAGAPVTPHDDLWPL